VRPPLLAHQQHELDAFGQHPARALFWEPGLGKTRATIEKFERRRNAAMLVVAPDGVHYAWLVDEFPKHASREYRGFVWQQSRSTTKKHQREFEALLRGPVPAVMTTTWSAIRTKRGFKAAEKFLKTFGKHGPVRLVADEGHRLQDPNSIQSRSMRALRKLADEADLLTGTPVGNSPFSMWNQMRFLDPDFWVPHELTRYTTFKSKFGIWEKGYNRRQEREFKSCVGYRNEELLHRMIAPAASRVLKKDALDLPPKTFTRRSFEMAPAQAKVYRDLRDNILAELDSGEEVTATMAMVRLMRLQQITSGYVTPDEAELPTLIMPWQKNPRLSLLRSIINERPTQQAIVWCRFTKDVDLVTWALADDEVKAARYDGRTPKPTRPAVIQSFIEGQTRVLVANPACAGEGLNLQACATAVYYSLGDKLRERQQSIDRIHRIGQDRPVEIIDIVAAGTVDEGKLARLEKNEEVAGRVTGDTLREWM
jgi:SNF2 family DNA or RNA helicase